MLKHLFSIILAICLCFLPKVYAANTATDNYTSSICFGSIYACEGIHEITVAIDTVDTDLIVHSPASGKTACLAGIVFSEGTAANLTIKSGTDTLVVTEMAANQGMFSGLEPPICTEAGEDLIIQSSAAITSMLFRVWEGFQYIVR